ncbi:MAG: helix-turn-helix domain-containing protein [Bacteroidetes bacterium]|nr:helix-turn-helix domain-containing protein [Bacteroidota bacterium]
MKNDSENTLFNLAAEVINFTSQNLFLTGKAGTGKTTFLKFIKEHTDKNAVVVAPTGVAAINAGGVTMHSFFQLPFVPYLSQAINSSGNISTVDRYNLIKNIRFSREKKELINELELLIIDEVSMLRADMLDAIDEILRHFRQQRRLPFGGVQVLFIGDLFQLPPVVKEQEWMMMRDQYASPFFFSAKVMEEHPPLFIEMKKIYRQKEQSFIDILNNIRNNEMNETDYESLHERFRPEAMDVFENSITLTTHNHIADNINQKELKKLETDLCRFTGEVKGEFSDKAMPTEMQLELKEGAQIMFIKNDSSGEQKYFNGKLAVIKSIRDEKISVLLADSHEELILEKEKWENIRYTLNRETNRVEEEELGSFTQYPVRLAWAITIHKSQGLTFDKAVIDAGASFAAGQVYVALSRCRTLDGIVLLSRIHPGSVQCDERILEFASRENSEGEIQKILLEEKPKFASQLLLRTFNWRKLVVELELFAEQAEEKKLPEKEMLLARISGMIVKAKAQQEVADKFIQQLEKILQGNPVDTSLLNDRVPKAKQFFSKALKEELIQPVIDLQKFLKGKSKVKQFIRSVNELDNMIWKKINDVQRVTLGEMTFDVPVIQRETTPVLIKKVKEEKGNSKFETLEFYKQGKTISEIAAQRGFAATTIESHLSEFVLTGEVNVFDFLNEDQISKIREAADEVGYEKFSPIKQVVGDSISYGQIKMGLNYIKSKNENKN